MAYDIIRSLNTCDTTEAEKVMIYYYLIDDLRVILKWYLSDFFMLNVYIFERSTAALVGGNNGELKVHQPYRKDL